MTRKLAPFTTTENVISGHTFPSHFQIGKIFYNGYVCRKVTKNELKRIISSTRHSGGEPIYIDSPDSLNHEINVYTPTALATTDVTCEVFKKPIKVEWGYVVVNEKALYNSNTSIDYTLHESEEDTLVFKILEIAGIVMNKVGLVQASSQVNANETQIQKV